MIPVYMCVSSNEIDRMGGGGGKRRTLLIENKHITAVEVHSVSSTETRH